MNATASPGPVAETRAAVHATAEPAARPGVGTPGLP